MTNQKMSISGPTKNSTVQAVTKTKGKKGTNLTHRQSTTFSDEINLIFKKYCNKYGCTNIPDMVFCNEEQQLLSTSSKNTKIFFIIKKTQENWNEKVIYRDYPIETTVIESLSHCLVDRGNLVILKFEYCHLQSEHLVLLSEILKMNLNIKDCSVNGNPNKEQNHYLLLEESYIETLSMKFCNINSEGVAKIVAKLYRLDRITLMHLNLASNSLFDEGAEHIAKLLRLNRKLISLNLADNKITSKGCEMLMHALKKFPLTHDEIVIRRQIQFEHFKNVIPTECKKMSRPHTASGKKRSIKERTSACSTKSGRHKLSEFDNTAKLANSIEYHPFVHDSFEEDNEIYCKGNDVLINLNLSYNRIPKRGLDCILDTLNYQKQNYHYDKGISRITIEGNEFNNTCFEEINGIEALLKLKQQLSMDFLVKSSSIKKGRSSENLKKRQ